MAVNAPAFTIVEPSFMEPGLILPYAQASGAFDCLATGAPLIKLADGDLFVYAKKVDIRTISAAGESAYNMLPSVNVTFSQVSTPTYLVRTRAEYDHHDTAAVARWGTSIAEMYRLGNRQAHVQMARSALLSGFQPQNGEGLLNTQGATLATLPADTNGNTTVVTYDNGQLAIWIIGQIQALKTRTNQLGIGQKFRILGPQRVLGQMEYSNVVQLTQYQRPGAGSTTTAGLVKAIAADNGDEILWLYDDTLIGKGAGGTDAVIITMPEVIKPNGGRMNTNVFAELAPGLEACVAMYADMPAPREIPTPIPGGGIDVLFEERFTSGWGLRPETISILSMQYQ